MTEHTIAGRMTGLTGTVTFCECGLAFFAWYEGEETSVTRRAAMTRADGKWQAHATAAGLPD